MVQFPHLKDRYVTFMELKQSSRNDIVAGGGAGFPNDQCSGLCKST